MARNSLVQSSARYGDTYRYQRYARVAIPLFDWDDFIELLLMHVAGLAMSDKPVSVDPANASSDETKSEIEL